MDCRQAVSLCCFEEGLSLVSEDPNICRTQPSYLTHSSNGPLQGDCRGGAQRGQPWEQAANISTHTCPELPLLSLPRRRSDSVGRLKGGAAETASW